MKNLKFCLFLISFSAIISFGVAQQKYALLITGDYDKSNLAIPLTEQWNGGNLPPDITVFDEFWNDTYLMWELLKSKKEYENDNIYVLCDEGIDFTFPGQDDRYKSEPNFPNIPFITDQSSSYSNIQGVFNTLDNIITPDDFLFVWVMSHGGTDAQGSYFYSYDAQKIYDTQLATWLGGINAHKKTVFLSFPSAGGFTEELEGTGVIIDSGIKTSEFSSL